MSAQQSTAAKTPATRPLGFTTRAVIGSVPGATLITETVKGHDSYRVVDASGAEVARSHVVQVKLGLYTLVVGGAFCGTMPQAVAHAKLTAMCG